MSFLVIIPGIPLLIFLFSIFTTGRTPTVVLVRNASLQLFISVDEKPFSITSIFSFFAISIIESLVTPPRMKLLVG